jgi:hypothetical protein
MSHGRRGRREPLPGEPGWEPPSRTWKPPPRVYDPPPGGLQFVDPGVGADDRRRDYRDPDVDDDDDADSAEPTGRLVTPFRLAAFLAMAVSGIIAAYSLVIARGSQSIAITVAALAVFGAMSLLVGVAFAAAGVRAARNGRVRGSFAGGLVGGLFAVLAAGAVAAAIVFGLLSQS